MDLKNSRSASNIKNKKTKKKFNNIDISYSTSETALRNKAIKKNNSLKTFNKSNNLRLNNNSTSKINSEYRTMTILTSSEIDHIKQAILNKFEENKSKEKINFFNNKSFNKEKSKKFNTKKNKKNKVDKILNKIEKKFEKYNKENIAYKVNHDYQKLNFNTEDYEDLNFLERMKLYSIKKNLKEEAINYYIRLKTPKLSDSKIKQVFDDLTNDVKIRKEQKAKREKEELNFYNNINDINNNSKNKKVKQKEIDDIIKRLSKPKKYFFYDNIKKEVNKDNKDIKLKNGGKDNNNNDNNNKKNNNNNKNKKNNIIKSHSMKSIKKSEQINKINNRLYYREMNKKDINYKLFMKNVNELLNTNKNIKPIIKENNDFISYEHLKKIRDKNKMVNIKTMNNRNIKSEYNFKDDENESFNDKKNKNVNDKNENNNYKGIKTHNNYNSNYNNNYNELFTFSKQQTYNSINNLKISIIIDNFFCNK